MIRVRERNRSLFSAPLDWAPQRPTVFVSKLTHVLPSISLFALVVQNTTLVILLKISFREDAEPYAPSTVVLTVECIKLIVCSTVVFLRSAKDLKTSVTQILRQWILFFPSLLHVIQNTLLFFGARRLSPIVYVLCTDKNLDDCSNEPCGARNKTPLRTTLSTFSTHLWHRSRPRARH